MLGLILVVSSVLMSVLPLASCAPSTRGVTFIAGGPAIAAGRGETTAIPVDLPPAVLGTPRHLVRAVPVALSSFPLPLTIEHIMQALASTGESGITDERGRITLRLLRGHAYLIVAAPLPRSLDALQPPRSETDPPETDPTTPTSAWRLDRSHERLAAWNLAEPRTDPPLRLVDP